MLSLFDPGISRIVRYLSSILWPPVLYAISLRSWDLSYCTLSLFDPGTSRIVRYLSLILGPLVLYAISLWSWDLSYCTLSLFDPGTSRIVRYLSSNWVNSRFPCSKMLLNHLGLFKDWSQFLFGSWRNNLNQVVHTCNPRSSLRKGVYNQIEVISNEPNK
jgi:hypothetical protein